ncbi:DUF397 domain-containing protein [Saccharopolyspora sp. WRP15-2]|uniref:DUF397 domain-containing protein n=1 Tax=Saccharopolyspora oryzae TaxID=2997343 RepID=A0ABT4V2S0_9PSEU|nr:DUF397 domain-containing protein [Saccharopolyspora oryzae]MDA3628265.1 DUF397 domain-containing protein [Saccharopolyspora oryzae]
MTTSKTWIKSSRSQSTSTCVELTTDLDEIRDSKNPSGPTLRVDVASFVQAVKDGRFDR